MLTNQHLRYSFLYTQVFYKFTPFVTRNQLTAALFLNILVIYLQKIQDSFRNKDCCTGKYSHCHQTFLSHCKNDRSSKSCQC